MTPQQKYRQTEKGKAARRRARVRYRQTKNGKAKQAGWRKTYFATPEGKAARARQDAARYERRMKDLHGPEYSVGATENRRAKPVGEPTVPSGITIHR
ncbi:MAG: hypothetical protein WC236_13680, partial [Gallionellaceae bacterium]